MRPTHRRFLELLRYGLVSAVALVVDAGLLSWLHYRLGIHYQVAAATSFILGGVVAYFLSIRFVFRHRRFTSHAVEAPTFILLGVVGLGVNALIIGMLVGNFSLPVFTAKICAAGVTFCVNFVSRKLLLFSPGPHPRVLPQDP